MTPTPLGRAALLAAADRVIAPPGLCAQCDTFAKRRITVFLHHSMSGPGVSVYACLPCARIRARSMFAPEWLREDLAIIDAAQVETAR